MTEYCLKYAVDHGDLKSVRELIDFGANVNGCISRGETPLLVASRGGHREIFDLLIQSGAQVNCGRDSDGWTPLHWASWRGWVDQVRLILEKGGTDLNAAAEDGKTPLLVAARRGGKETFDLLIQAGAQVNCGRDSYGWTNLHWASCNGWVDQVLLILEKEGADLNAAAEDGETPLIIAARKKRREIFDLLIQYGAQVNCGRDSDGWTPLHWASRNGWVDQVRLILEKGGTDLNAATEDGKTPLLVAARRGRKETFDLLIQAGARVNCGRDSEGWTNLHWASCNGWVDQVRLILGKEGADLNAAAEDGETSLIVASRSGHIEIFDLLIQSGAQVNCGRDSYGWTPLHWASWRGWVDQVSLILENGGAVLNATAYDGDTPLMVAARSGYREIFIILLQYGATMDINYALISKHSFLKVAFTDVNLCTQSIVNKFHCQSLPSLYRNPDIGKKLPFSKNFKLKDQQKQEIAKFVESEIKSKKFCHVFNSQPLVLMLLCVQSLISHRSTRNMSASSDSNLPF